MLYISCFDVPMEGLMGNFPSDIGALASALHISISQNPFEPRTLVQNYHNKIGSNADIYP